MKIIFLSNFCKRTGSLDICFPKAAAAIAASLVGAVTLAAWVGFQFGERHGDRNAAGIELTEVRQLLEAERRLIDDAKADQRAHLDALALKIADLQAHLMRLDALGGRLVEVGKLDQGEFDFLVDPPVGGVELGNTGESVTVEELGADLARINALLSDRESKLVTLEQTLMTQDLMAQVTPSGRPVEKGWMSSVFGKRTDPFTGKKTFHRGVDFAGKPGTEVMAVAAGVVERAERASGFGNFVEIRHADGYSTLYAHNQENLVNVGDVVSKGQTIALLGSTGRSSGPHVHFEVHRNGKIVNPRRFVR